jgi:YHS domain-containing protein
MLLTSIAIATSLLAAVPPLPAAKPAEPKLFPVDPVLFLGSGDRLDGPATREVVYGNFRYRFATESSKRAFEAMPRRFAVALGGCCPRMGPLSTPGSVYRYENVDGLLYIFASDACREQFVRSPGSFAEPTDEPISGDARGIELAAAARRWLRADAACPKDIVVWSTREQAIADKPCKVRSEIRLGANLTFTELNAWDDAASWTTASFGIAPGKSDAVYAQRSTADPERVLDEAQIEAFRRVAMNEPLFLARVILQTDVKFRSLGAAEWKVGAKDAPKELDGEVLRIQWHGMVVDWLVKPGSGQPVAQRVQRRVRDARFAEVTEAFSEWNDRGGVRVPLVRTDDQGTTRFDAVESACDAAVVEVVPELKP